MCLKHWPYHTTCAIAIIAIGAIAVTTWLESHRIDKIDFIIADRRHQNIAKLNPQKLEWYLQECGASVAKEPSSWRISYRGITKSKHWVIGTPTATKTGT